LCSLRVKREKVESEAAATISPVRKWRVVVEEIGYRPYHPEDVIFEVGSVFGILNRRCLVGDSRVVVVSVALCGGRECARTLLNVERDYLRIIYVEC